MSKLIKDTLAWFVFLSRLVLNGNFKNSIKKDCQGKTIALLANGPSLKDELPKLEKGEEFSNVDFIVLNFFAFEEVFFQIKPQHYCFADPMFFQKNHKYADVKRLYEVLDSQVTWEMNIYIPNKRYNDFIVYSKLKNKNIKITRVNVLEYSGYECIRFFFYKRGLAMPRVQTVANLAIFLALNKGYSIVHLYGVDHTFFDSLCVNEQNQLCNRERHFYDDQSAKLKPILRNDNDEIWKISDYLDAITNMFKSHDQLAAYAKKMDIQIWNYTKNSMIDSYDRM